MSNPNAKKPPAALIAGIYFGFIALFAWGVYYQELPIYERGHIVPKQVSVEELGEQGPVDNMHVVVENCAVDPRFTFVNQKRKRVVWFAVRPVGAEPSTRPKVVFRHFGLLPTDEKEIQTIVSKASAQGIVINSIDRLRHQDDVWALRQLHSDCTYENTWIIGLNRGFPTENIMIGSYWIAVCSSLGLLLVIVYRVLLPSQVKQYFVF